MGTQETKQNKGTKRIIRKYAAYSPKQHGTPWVTLVGLDGKITFDCGKVGEYTGGRGTGNKGALVVFKPIKNQVYAYGRKNYTRCETENGKSRDVFYVMYKNGKFSPCDRFGMSLDVWGMSQRLRKEYGRLMDQSW